MESVENPVFFFKRGARFQKSLQEELKAMFDAMDDNKDGWLGDSMIVVSPRWSLSFMGDEKLAIYIGTTISHEISIPINQPGFHGIYLRLAFL